MQLKPLRRRIVILLAVAAMAAIAALALRNLPKPTLAERIAHEKLASRQLDLAALTDFPWDQARVFGPYTSRARVCSALPSSWQGCHDLPADLDEGHFLLVFVNGSEVVHHELVHRSAGNFCADSCSLAIARNDAQFDLAPYSPVGPIWTRRQPPSKPS